MQNLEEKLDDLATLIDYDPNLQDCYDTDGKMQKKSLSNLIKVIENIGKIKFKGFALVFQLSK